jgi:hypothetical protein
VTNIWVLIPAARAHIAHVNQALEPLSSLRGRTVVVTNGDHPPTKYEIPGVHLVQDRTPGVNISRWWNLGLDWVWDRDVDDHHVLVMNADTRIDTAGVARLSWALDHNPQTVMAGPMLSPGLYFEARPGFRGLEQRVPGYCFMLTSKHPLRADEQFEWWSGDDDLEWRARESGGTVRVGPIRYQHLGDGVPRGRLAETATQDLIRFEKKWGVRPW